mgnify:CR=1 FL=1
MEEGNLILVLILIGVTITLLTHAKIGGKIDKRKNHPKSNHRNIR